MSDSEHHHSHPDPCQQSPQDIDELDSQLNTSNSWQAALAKYRPLLIPAAKALALFVFCFVALILLLDNLLPSIDPADRPAVKIPRNFEELKALNQVLQIYNERHFLRVLGSFIALYLFLQAYSLPGSMYLNILAGAMYGVLIALPLVCVCIATGATMCYLISALLGPALLLANTTWKDRLEVWRDRVRSQGSNMISYLILLRISPLPPHWVVNIVAPHLQISIPLFWISTFLGVLAVSFIHVQIGTTLDQMTSSSDFHLLSLRNFLGLAGVVAGVLFPVALRHYLKQELNNVVSGESATTLSLPNSAAQARQRSHGQIDIVIHTSQQALLDEGSKRESRKDDEPPNVIRRHDPTPREHPPEILHHGDEQEQAEIGDFTNNDPNCSIEETINLPPKPAKNRFSFARWWRQDEGSIRI